MSKNAIVIAAALVVIAVAGLFIYYKKSPKPRPDKIGSFASGNKFERNGVQVEILKEGTGAVAKNGDKVSVNYTGVFKNGVKFDSSLDRGVPFEFTLGGGQVIIGWDIGVSGMRVGEKRKLIIPPELAYGLNGAGNLIPPNSTLIFEIELLAIK